MLCARGQPLCSVCREQPCRQPTDTANLDDCLPPCAGSSTEVQLLADWMPWLNGLMTELQDAGCMKELEIMAGLMQQMGTFLPSKVAAGVGDWGRQAMAMTEPEVCQASAMVLEERVVAV